MAGAIKTGGTLFATLLLLAMPTRAQDTDFAGEDGARVIGGQRADRSEWPWQVKILSPDPEQRGRFAGHCGGSLIAPRWILTAAHCVTNGRSGVQELFARDLLIVEGKSKVDKIISVIGPDKPGLDVVDVIVHEAFDRKVFANDIALIKLAKPAVSRAVALSSASDRSTEAPDKMATVTGWGYNKADHGWDDKYLPTELQEVELPLVSTETCRAGYRDSSMRLNPIDDRTICAGYAEGGKDACQGDSGGPLVALRPDRTWIQIGVVSWGAGCAEAGKYGVYTRVAAFRDWIAAKTGNDVPADPIQVAGIVQTPPGASASHAPTPDGQAVQQDKQPAASAPSRLAPETPPVQAQKMAQTASAPGDRALLIGIDDYGIAEAKLYGAVADAEAMQALLVRALGFKPNQIHTLTNRDATRAAILAEIDDWLVRQSQPASRVILYFAGQGSAEAGAGAVNPTLVAADAALIREGGKLTGVTNQIVETEIAARLNSLKDRRVTVIVDACHVGPGSRSASPALVAGSVRCLGPALAALSPPSRGGNEAKFTFGGKTAMVWSAVSAGQWALTQRNGAKPGGVFTKSFIDGVDGGVARASEKLSVSNAALLDYVRRQSDAYCLAHAEECRYTPVPQFYGGPDALGRDIVTGEEAKTPVAAVENTLKGDNDAGISIDVIPGTSVKIGDKVAMRVSTKKPGYLILVDIDSSGKLTQLYPNRRSMGLHPAAKSGDNRLGPEKAVVVPDRGNPYIGFEYVVEGPAGVGMVVAILSDTPIEVLDLPDIPAPLAGQRAAFNYVYDLARSLRIVGEDGDGAKGKWSFDSKFYRVQ
ncbi:trypsin-like serine protease [Neorhizobium galegae]|nr:trypsin-like serine protease [Neorhizobium galegae]